jgi:tellurite resistance protein TehA-like permease
MSEAELRTPKRQHPRSADHEASSRARAARRVENAESFLFCTRYGHRHRLGRHIPAWHPRAPDDSVLAQCAVSRRIGGGDWRADSVLPRAFAADIQSHSRGVGFFTTVAATAVFGTELVLLMDAAGIAAVFWIAATLLWFVTIYGVLAVPTVKPDKPSLADGLNGGWLVSVVASQAVALLTVLISAAGVLVGLERPLLLVALVLCLGGGALYLWIVTLIFFRYTFIHMAPEDLTPPYWINMGAVAISTPVGATLIEHTALSRDVAEIAPFVTGCTLVFWAIATWWIPMLLVLGVWRYLICGLPLAYDPLHWGGVFPLGMYSVATYHLAKILAAPFLLPLSWLFMVIAVLAWAATFAGLVDSRLNRLSDGGLADAEGALSNARATGHAPTLLNALAVMEKLYTFSGNFASAFAAIDELGALADEKGAFAWKTAETTGRGRLLALTGKPSEAIQVLTSGLADAAQRSKGTTLYQPFNLLCLAHAHAELAQFDDAWRRIGEAMTAMETTKEKWCEAEVYRTAGEIALKSPEPEVAKAETYFERALTVARYQQAKSWELCAAMSMGRLWRDQGKRQPAHDLVAPVYGWFTEGFDTLDLKQAKALLDELT